MNCFNCSNPITIPENCPLTIKATMDRNGLCFSCVLNGLDEDLRDDFLAEWLSEPSESLSLLSALSPELHQTALTQIKTELQQEGLANE